MIFATFTNFQKAAGSFNHVYPKENENIFFNWPSLQNSIDSEMSERKNNNPRKKSSDPPKLRILNNLIR